MCRFRIFSLLATHNENCKAKEAHTRETSLKVNVDAKTKVKVGDTSKTDTAMSSAASMRKSWQKLSTLTPD
jgi:hypothetical protein